MAVLGQNYSRASGSGRIPRKLVVPFGLSRPRSLLLTSLLLGGGVFGFPRSGRADPDVAVPSELRSVRLAVPRALAPRKYGRDALTKGARAAVKAGLGRVVSTAAWRRHRKKLGLRGSKAKTTSAFAAIAQKCGADWVLQIRVTRKGWLYTARALLIRTADGEIQMDFRSQYYKPSTEARDRGRRIGERTVQKLASLLEAAPSPHAQAPPLEDRTAASPRDEPPRPPKNPEPAPEPPLKTPERAPEPPPRTDEVAEVTPLRDEPPPSLQPGDRPTAVRSERPTRTSVGTAEDPHLLRIALTAGAGVLRTYDVGASGLERSALSHSLEPVSLFDLRAELLWPRSDVSIEARVAFRPVAYETSASADTTSNPSGFFLDARTTVGIQLPVGDRRSKDPRLIVTPRLGARLSVGSVDDHPGPVVLDSTTLLLLAAVSARLPLNEVLELEVGVDGGPILLYEESPGFTGDAGVGFSLGGDLSARIWLTETVAIAFDNRFTYDSVPFSGSPSRRVPLNEQSNFTNAEVSVRDLRASLGVALRL